MKHPKLPREVEDSLKVEAYASDSRFSHQEAEMIRKVADLIEDLPKRTKVSLDIARDVLSNGEIQDPEELNEILEVLAKES